MQLVSKIYVQRIQDPEPEHLLNKQQHVFELSVAVEK